MRPRPAEIANRIREREAHQEELKREACEECYFSWCPQHELRCKEQDGLCDDFTTEEQWNAIDV